MFLNLALAGGLIAVAAPIIIHIIHRRKITQVRWGAMLFLIEMLKKSSSRLFIDQWLLLLVRTLLVGLLALALMRPALSPESLEKSGDMIIRRGRVAAVIVFDDSASTGVGRGESSMNRMKQLALVYMDTLQRGDEVSLLKLSELDQPMSDPLFDLEASRELIRKITPAGVTSDVPTLVEAGILQLTRHLNPAAEVVLLTDGSQEGWEIEDLNRWNRIRDQLEDQNARLIILSPPWKSSVENLSVTDISVNRRLIPAGGSIDISVKTAHRGEHVPTGSKMTLTIDRQIIGEKSLMMDPGSQKEVSFTHVFDAPGSHVIAARVTSSHDAFTADDIRGISVEVQQEIPVLLVEPEKSEKLGGTLGLVAAALSTDRLFKVTRISAAGLADIEMKKYRTILLGDVPAIDATTVSRLERFIVSGGGLLVNLGRRTEAGIVNRFWARNGDGFMPCPLSAVFRPESPLAPAGTGVAHPALVAFTGKASSAWEGSRIDRYWRLNTSIVDQSDIQVLLRLGDRHPLLVERDRGLGKVVILTTSLNLEWSDLPTRPAFVPLMRGIIGHLVSNIVPPRNLRPGQPLIHIGNAEVAEGPRKLRLSQSAWEGRSARSSRPVDTAGIYRVREAGKQYYYTFNLDPSESSFNPVAMAEVKKITGFPKSILLTGEEEIRRVLDPNMNKPVELWRWFLAGAIVLLFVETIITRMQGRA